MSLSVDDILEDLAKLQQSQPSSSSSLITSHPILSLGNSLLPSNLQSDRRLGSSIHSSARSESDLTSNITTSLDDALDRVDNSQSDALHLSSVYLENTRRVLALNQDRDRQASLESDQQETGGLFDDLHRRVAKMQSSNEVFRDRLQDIRHLIVETAGKEGQIT